MLVFWTINGIHQQSRLTYGAPRITAELIERKVTWWAKTGCARLMKVAGIAGVNHAADARHVTTLRGQDKPSGSQNSSGGAKLPGQPLQTPTVGSRHHVRMPSWAGRSFVYLALAAL